MISKKEFVADGNQFRFLSDFIIRSEQFARVYNYVYDANGVDGDVDPSSGLFIRVTNKPKSQDLVTIDRWDLVDNSISFYTSPQAGTQVYFEVATTAEEFGETLIQPAVERAEAAADAAAASAIAAGLSEAAAALSEAASALSETNASASASAALASQNASALSEANASASETAAGLSAAAAALSEAAAQLAETNAEAAQAAAEAAQLAAETAQGLAETAQLASETAQGLSESARDKAELWAEEADNVEVEAGKYSAKHWANVATTSPAINTFKNKLINGGFDVWQRGASFNSSGVTYTADRWAVYNSGTICTTTREWGVNSLYMLNVAGAIGNTQFQVFQRIEQQNIWRNKNGNTVLSLTIQSDIVKDIDIWCAYPNATDNWASNTEFYRKTITLQIGSNNIEEIIALPNDVEKGLVLIFELSAHTSGNIGFDTVQLEEGSVATPFEQRPVGVELSLCQRYYQTINLNTGGNILADGYYGAGSYLIWRSTRPVRMRIIPSSSLSLALLNADSGGVYGESVDTMGAYARVIAAGRAYITASGLYIADAEL